MSIHKASLLLVLLGALGCSQPRGVVIKVSGLQELPSDAVLRVTWRLGDGALQDEDFPREGLKDAGEDSAQLGLQLPESASGKVQVTVRALPVPDAVFAVAVGGAEGELSNVRLDLSVTLKAQQVCSKSGWCWEAPLPSARSLRSVWAVARDDVWAVGEFGTLMHYDGRYWTVEPLPLEAGEPDLYALWASGPDDVWAVGGLFAWDPLLTKPDTPAVILHRDAQGWRLFKTDPGWSAVYAVWGVAPGEVWVGGQVGPRSNMTASGFLQRCSAQSRGCDSERLVAEFAPVGLWSRGGDAPVWAVGQTGWLGGGYILRKNAGQSWENVIMPANRAFRHVFGSGENLWVGAWSTDRWPWYVPTSQLLYRIPGMTDGDWAGADSKLLPLFDDGTWLYGISSDGGVAHQARRPLADVSPNEGALPRPTGALRDVAQLPPITTRQDVLKDLAVSAIHGVEHQLWASGGEGLLRHKADGDWGARGALPIVVPPAAEASIGQANVEPPIVLGLWARSTSEVYAVGERGLIMRSDGRGWRIERSGTKERLLGVWGTAEGEVFAVGLAGTILRRTGEGWVPQDVPLRKDLFTVWGAKAGDLFAAGEEGVILRWTGDAQGGWVIDKGAEAGASLFSLWGAEGDEDRWAVGCAYRLTDNPTPVALRRTGTGWVNALSLGVKGLRRCFHRVWFEKGSPARVSAPGFKDAGSGLLYSFNRAQPIDEMPTTLMIPGDRCTGLALSSILLCSTVTGGQYVDLANNGSGSFEFGAETGRWLGSFFVQGDDIWYYGAGILHCRNSADCLNPRSTTLR